MGQLAPAEAETAQQAVNQVAHIIPEQRLVDDQVVYHKELLFGRYLLKQCPLNALDLLNKHIGSLSLTEPSCSNALELWQLFGHHTCNNFRAESLLSDINECSAI